MRATANLRAWIACGLTAGLLISTAHAQAKKGVFAATSTVQITSALNHPGHQAYLAFATIGGTQKWAPPHKSGDKEFAGNGPRVVVRVHFYLQNNRIYRRLYMSAIETDTRWKALSGQSPTRAYGWSKPEVAYKPPAGTTIVSLH